MMLAFGACLAFLYFMAFSGKARTNSACHLFSILLSLAAIAVASSILFNMASDFRREGGPRQEEAWRNSLGFLVFALAYFAGTLVGYLVSMEVG